MNNVKQQSVSAKWYESKIKNDPVLFFSSIAFLICVLLNSLNVLGVLLLIFTVGL